MNPRECAACFAVLPVNAHGNRKFCLDCVPDYSGKAWRAANREYVEAYNAARRHDFAPKPCVVCGTDFKPRRKDDRYCGERCRNRRPRKRSAMPRRVVFRGWRDCPCGKRFEWAPRYREKFCSKPCATTFSARGQRCEWRCDVPWKKCVYCGSSFTSRVPNAKYCSQSCEPNWRPVPPRKLTCEVCGSAFLGPGGTKYCSPRCVRRSEPYRDQRSRHNHNRRVRLKGGERVYRSRIFKRDGWICQLCHRKVNKALKYPHPMSASLDHIIPAADDESSHDPRNVQLAHWLCNVKRREVGPAQMILFGEIAA